MIKRKISTTSHARVIIGIITKGAGKKNESGMSVRAKSMLCRTAGKGGGGCDLVGTVCMMRTEKSVEQTF